MVLFYHCLHFFLVENKQISWTSLCLKNVEKRQGAPPVTHLLHANPSPSYYMLQRTIFLLKNFLWRPDPCPRQAFFSSVFPRSDPLINKPRGLKSVSQGWLPKGFNLRLGDPLWKYKLFRNLYKFLHNA